MAIDRGFFASKYFVLSAVVAVGIVAGGATAYYAGGRVFSQWHDGCDAPVLAGAPLTFFATQTLSDQGERRTVRYTADLGAFQGGALDLCVDVGEVLLSATNGTSIEVEFLVESDHATAVQATQVEAALRDEGGRLVLAAWESQRGEAGSWLGTQSARVRLTVRVPASAAYEVRAVSNVGDVRVSDLLASTLRLETDVGDVVATRLDLQGDATLMADVGDAILSAVSVQTGEISLASNVGNVEAELPASVDVGYDAHASADVGEVMVRLGDTESHESDGEGPGETESARTSNYAQKPTQVVVRARTDVGDARIVVA